MDRTDAGFHDSLCRPHEPMKNPRLIQIHALYRRAEIKEHIPVDTLFNDDIRMQFERDSELFGVSKIEAELAKVESDATASRLNERTALFKKSQFEAIDQAGLGDKEDNIAAIGKLSSQATKYESVAIKEESQVTILRRRVAQHRATVEAQAQKVAGLEGDS